ncbi:MAG: hypothetical protein LiPW41_297 [Parcubacteria group bacterium LiPW_41]|nr:MAG: hypothetical protein LiPW41_297 [Parcubacteria group bacterium LiPW_41]
MLNSKSEPFNERDFRFKTMLAAVLFLLVFQIGKNCFDLAKTITIKNPTTVEIRKIPPGKFGIWK